MRVFENMATKKIFGPERVEITEELDKLHNEALHNFYPSPNILLIIKGEGDYVGGNVTRMGGGNCAGV